MIVLNVPSIIRVLKIPVVSYNQDIAVGAKQLADYLLVFQRLRHIVKILDIMMRKVKRIPLSLIREGLLKAPGYEILIT